LLVHADANPNLSTRLGRPRLECSKQALEFPIERELGYRGQIVLSAFLVVLALRHRRWSDASGGEPCGFIGTGIRHLLS